MNTRNSKSSKVFGSTTLTGIKENGIMRIVLIGIVSLFIIFGITFGITACGGYTDYSGSTGTTTAPNVTDPCSDGQRNGYETDVDCGGPACAKCVLEKGCTINADCVSSYCDASHKCAATPDPLQTCLDACPVGCVTPGSICFNDGKEYCSDCIAACYGATRVSCPATCTDGLKNGNETDVDCGGPDCAKCAVNQHCLDANDCVSGYCNAQNVCDTLVDPCTDGVQDGDETDVDCGGSCTKKCKVNQGCDVNDDCDTFVCDVGAGVCSKGIILGYTAENRLFCPNGTIQFYAFDNAGNRVNGPVGGSQVIMTNASWLGYVWIGALCNGASYIDWTPFLGKTAAQIGLWVMVDGVYVGDETMICAPTATSGPGVKPAIPLTAADQLKCPTQ